MKRNKKSVTFITTNIVLGILCVLLYCADRRMFLYIGLSLFNHNILPFNTRINRDKDITGYEFSFANSSKNYYQLGTQMRWDKEPCNVQTTCYDLDNNICVLCVETVLLYGYTKDELIIKIRDIYGDSFWVKVDTIGRTYPNKEYCTTPNIYTKSYYKNILIDENNITKKIYKWVDLYDDQQYALSSAVIITWSLIIILIGIMLFLDIVLCVSYIIGYLLPQKRIKR